MSSASPTYETLRVTHDQGVATITLNRPNKFNAINATMYHEIATALNSLSTDDSVVVTVITGSGLYYSSGNDLSEMNASATSKSMASPEAIAKENAVRLEHFVDSFITHSKPLIAGVNGPAFGIAVTTLALCDLVYASETATFQTPFASLGQSPEGVSSILFPRLMGSTKSNEVLLFGKKLNAQEAERRNLVTEVLPQHDFHKMVHTKALSYAQFPKDTLQQIKKLLRSYDISQLRDANRRECELLIQMWLSPDCMNAIIKFIQDQRRKTKEKKMSSKL